MAILDALGLFVLRTPSHSCWSRSGCPADVQGLAATFVRSTTAVEMIVFSCQLIITADHLLFHMVELSLSQF